MIRSAPARERCEKTETEAPFAWYDQICSFLQTKCSSYEVTSKFEHSIQWSPRRCYVRANFVDVEMPKKMSQFAELKTLTENARSQRETCFKLPLQGSRMEKRTDQWSEGEASQEQREHNLETEGEKKKHPVGEDEDMEEEVTDRISQVQSMLMVQLESRVRDVESATDCTLFPPRTSAFRDRNAKQRQNLQRHGNEPTSQGKRKPAHPVLRGDAESQGEDPPRTRPAN